MSLNELKTPGNTNENIKETTPDNGHLYLEYERLNKKGDGFEELLMEDYTNEYLKKSEEIHFGSSNIQCLKKETRQEIERIVFEIGQRQCAILNSIMTQ